MAGTTLDRELTPVSSRRARFRSATPEDDEDIRRLLRNNPMPGRIALSLEREPDYFADCQLAETEKQTVVAWNDASMVCVGSCAVRSRFVNGKPRRVGYLGGLRLDRRAAGRFDIVRRGYEFFRGLQADNPADFYFTSIASDNIPARVFLERGLPRMPIYEFVGEFVTMLLPVRRNIPEIMGSEDAPPSSRELLECLSTHGRHHQFAECWSARELASLANLGLRTADFRCGRVGGRLTAAAALWDQRGFKQTVIRNYAPWLTVTRPVVNLVAHILGTPRLPPVGSTLAHAFVSHLAAEPGNPAAFISLIKRLQTSAGALRIEHLTIGVAANDPRLGPLRQSFRHHEYRSRIYVVRWPGLGGSAAELDGRCLGPEVAQL